MYEANILIEKHSLVRVAETRLNIPCTNSNFNISPLCINYCQVLQILLTPSVIKQGKKTA